MISSVVEPVVSALGVNTGRVMLGVSMIAVAFYYRRALGIASMVQGVLAYLVSGVVLLGILVIAGIIPTVNFGVALDYGQELIGFGRDALPFVRSVLPV